jgi:hypothetical protein
MGYILEWERVKQDLEALSEVEVFEAGRAWRLKDRVSGLCVTGIQGRGRKVPPSLGRA